MLIQSISSVWKQYVEHDFVKQLARGTLNRSSFVHFIKFVLRFSGGCMLSLYFQVAYRDIIYRQDYLYLKYYARAYA